MNKRDFIRITGIGVLGITIGTPLLESCQTGGKKPGMPLWVWMSAGKSSIKELDSKFRELANLGVHGILIQASEEIYRKAAPLAKNAGLEIHSWIVVLNHRNRETKENHPEWFTI